VFPSVAIGALLAKAAATLDRISGGRSNWHRASWHL
jgi:alkanesulfonate monooxygenase SsuD/methylene tetrahydromethanopterin reductase-like flavin-dependent oxidoreductase (luciferase family)